jgi:protein arginine N-methyltransferase 1
MLLSYGTLHEHAGYLQDKVRLEAYERALRAVVRPGDRVLDLGAGTGVLGLLALRAGAGRVYVVEEGPVLEVARALHAAQGTTTSAVFVRGHSRRIVLPERVDLVVGDQVGYLGHGAGLLESYADAARRHLKPGGRLVPAALQLWAAPAQVDDLHGELAAWASRPAGMDMSPLRELLRSARDIPVLPDAMRLLGPEAALGTLELADAGTRTFSAQAQIQIARPGRLDALVGWFTALLAPGVEMTNAPQAPGRIQRPCGALPLDPAPQVDARDSLAFTFRLDARSGVRLWSVDRSAGPEPSWGRRHASLDGLLLAPGQVERLQPTHRPRLGPLGQAQASLLRLVDGTHTLEAVAQALVGQHAALFPSLPAALDFVRETLGSLEADAPPGSAQEAPHET